LDTEDQVLAHTFGEGFPLELIGANVVGPDDFQSTVAIDTGDDIVWDVAVPIFNNKAGIARVGISTLSVRQTLNSLTIQLTLAIVIVIIVSLLAATTLTWVLTRPIITLVDATKRIASGDFSSRVERWAEDEIGDLAVSFNQMAGELGRMDELWQEREQLRGQLLEGVISAQEEERKRIARELHDSTSQSLTSLMIGLRNLTEFCDNPEIYPRIDQLREETSRTLEDVHSLALQLRPTVLDDIGLKVAMERLVEEWEDRHNVNADVFVHLGNDRLPGFLETALFRIVQEALANIAKHANANSVSVLVERRNDDVVTIIEDDGSGFDINNNSSGGRLGLLSMQERAGILDGKLEIESGPGMGTSVFVTIPITRRKKISDE
jgi:signal transduction histidine kinase